MKVFISWSKSASKQLAIILRDWLPDVIQEIKPWMSSEDIEKGQRWAREIGTQLGDLGQGIICLTSQNQREPWINFEAGALAKLDEAKVRPLLLDLKPAEVTGPLAQFQATVATDREDMLRLVTSLNEACVTSLESVRLERNFDRLWGEYIDKVSKISVPPATSGVSSSIRSTEDMIGELLDRVRDLQRSNRLSPSLMRSSTSGRHGRGSILLQDGRVQLGDPIYHVDGDLGILDRIMIGKDGAAKIGVLFDGTGRFVAYDELRAQPVEPGVDAVKDDLDQED